MTRNSNYPEIIGIILCVNCWFLTSWSVLLLQVEAVKLLLKRKANPKILSDQLELAIGKECENNTGSL